MKQQFAEQEQLADGDGMGNKFVETVRICGLEWLDEHHYFRFLVVHLVELIEHRSVGLQALFNVTNVL